MDRNDYTIGWFCALPFEQTAALAMLDEKHPDLPKTEGDPNAYTLGRIGLHNVVIACLPDGRYGNNMAAIVTAWMVASFPKVRVGLLVGIGAGIPSTVQLGDVVVSRPGNSYPGVVQWDFGKAESGGKFNHTGSLNNPPVELSTTVSKLRSRHRMEGSRIREILDEVERKYSRLKPQYTRPPLISSPPIPSRSLDVRDMNLEMEQDTTDIGSSEHHDAITIHYGLIASGNSLVRDAALREKINERFGGHVLCIEMEAAGLKENFPCLVIRGISDHADPDKADLWQEYAATVASAHGKEILLTLPVQEIQRMDSIKPFLNSLKTNFDSFKETTQEMYCRQLSDHDQQILKWLSPLEPGKTQSDYLARTLPGTGKWLLNDSRFIEWKTNAGETLFCPGIPGAGKTFLTSLVIEHLENVMVDKNVGIAYVYCAFQPGHKQTVQAFLASILEQLARRQPLLSKNIRTLHEKHNRKGTRPTLQEICDILEKTAKTYSRVFILIDALDEYQENRQSGDNWQRFLDEIFDLQSKTKASLFATSRFIPPIIKRFQNNTTLEIRAKDEDLYKYIDQNISRLPGFVRHRDGIQDGVRDWILRSTDGMFLIADLLLNSLMDKLTPNAILESLQERPRDTNAYEFAYSKALDRIEAQLPGYRLLAKQTILFIAFTKRPLTCRELQQALAARSGLSGFDDDNLSALEDIVRSCVGLVTVDTHSDIIRLVHYTTQEFFEKHQDLLCENTQIELTEACINSISLDLLQESARLERLRACRRTANREAEKLEINLEAYNVSDLSGFFEEFAKLEDYETSLAREIRRYENCFLNYSTIHWGDHAYHTPSLKAKVIDLLASEEIFKGVGDCCNDLWISHSLPPLLFWTWTRRSPSLNVLHTAAFFGLTYLVPTLVERIDVNSKTSDGRTALSFASKRGYKSFVRLLLEAYGADARIEDDNGTPPILLASQNGHHDVVHEILHAIRNDKTYNQQLLRMAIQRNSEHIFQSLTSREDIDVDAPSSDGSTPFLLSCSGGMMGFITRLVGTGKVNVRARNDKGQSALFLTVKAGHANVIKKFLQNKTFLIEDFVEEQGSLLGLAVSGKDKRVMSILLEYGLDPNLGYCGKKPLELAFGSNFSGPGGSIVNMLLNEGADPRMTAECGGELLRQAALRGLECLEAKLLAKGACPGGLGGVSRFVPLSKAARSSEAARYSRGWGGKCSMCMDHFPQHGVDPNMADLDGSVTPSLAMKACRLPTVQALPKSSHSIVSSGESRVTRGPGQMRHFLLEPKSMHEASLDTSDQGAVDCLFAASILGREEAVHRLLNSGQVDINSRNIAGETPLALATRLGHAAIVRHLLNTGLADIHNVDMFKLTPYYHAYKSENMVIRQLFRQHMRETFGRAKPS
ncbi:hypothetical protein FGRMN_1225 [Fusarium graminum]|nr:hypothetical protein FGRMN_1225 [Fusarium graminum]